MGKNLKIAVKAKGFTIYPFLLKEPKNKDGAKIKGTHRGVNIRIVHGQKIVFDVECYDKNNIRIRATEFLNGYITGGWSKDTINMLNNRIDDLVRLVRDFIITNNDLSKPLLMSTLYGSDFAVKHKKRRRKYVTIPVLDYKGVITTSYELSKDQIEDLIKPHLTKQTFVNNKGEKETIEGIFDPQTGENAIQSEEDYFDLVTVLNEEKIDTDKKRAEAERIENMAPADKYKEGRWNADNIFEAIGYLVYGTERKGKNHKPILNPKFHPVLKRLIMYRENNPQVKTSIKDFNDQWLYDYYNWISERNAKSFMRSLDKPNPFKTNVDYVMNEDVEYEPYSFDTFRDNIHKEITMTIGALVEKDLIPKKIKLDIEDYGNTSFGKKVFSLAPSEFLSLLKAKKLTEIEEQVRDAFSVMVWTGNRPSDYRTDKAHTNIDGVVSVQFVSPKTGLAIDAFLSPPVQKVYERWKGFPDVPEQKFNTVLRGIAERLKLNRIIEKPVSRIGEERKVEKYALSDFISAKFGRGTYYTIGALTGRSFDELMNVAGHTDKSIVNRHYWNVGAKVSGEVKRELMKIWEDK